MRGFAVPGLWLALWLLGWVLCIVLSLMPAVDLPGPAHSDKIGHFLAYFILSAWAVWTFRSRRAHLLAALALVALGVAMEFAQANLTKVRLGDVRDALANTLGVAVGLSLTFTPLQFALERVDRKLFRTRNM
ncbi:VanZ family protein [uncultured Arenimonas sp.]|uniref:VanZ family protein n=1 Tax=uncultured Arenimonas sp. TaxID=546226 RepID=UPI0030D7C626